MSAQRIAKLAAILDRGLTKPLNPTAEEAWLGYLAEYEALTDEARSTCLRRERAARHPDGAGRYVERRLPSIR